MMDMTVLYIHAGNSFKINKQISIWLLLILLIKKFMAFPQQMSKTGFRNLKLLLLLLLYDSAGLQ